MQLFLFTPFLLVLIHRKPYTGKVLMCILTLISVIWTGVITFLDHLPPTLIFDNPDPLSRKPFGNTILVKPYPHAAPYLIGMMTGYFLHSKPDFKINPRRSMIGWTASCVIIFVSLFITWQWNQGHHPSLLFGSLYAACFRGLWGASMAWIVIACQYGQGGFVDIILSWRPFVPMSRVSYVAYLIHPGLMYVFVASTRNLFMFSHFLVIYLFLSHLLATFIASFILSLIIEIPFMRLENAFYTYIYNPHQEEAGDRNSNMMHYSITQAPHIIGFEMKKVLSSSTPRGRTDSSETSSTNRSQQSLVLHPAYDSAGNLIRKRSVSGGSVTLSSGIDDHNRQHQQPLHHLHEQPSPDVHNCRL